MLPKLEIKLSRPFNLILNDNFSYEEYMKAADKVIDEFNVEFKKFEKRTKPLQRAFKKNEKKIPKLIEKYSGYKWKGQQIPIYLVNMTQKPSIGDPLTIKFRDNIDSMLILLIHELTHLNLPQKMQMNAGNRKCEQWVNLVTHFVATEMKLDMNNIPMKNMSDCFNLGWDLKKKTLKRFIL